MADQQEIEVSSDVYRTLLESTKAIPWRIDWATQKFTYIGPQIESLLGWAQDSWKTVEDWATRMHMDDRDAVVNYCVSQSSQGVDHEADYRALTKDNRFVWIRDVVHVVREQGEVKALVGFMFDISTRKMQEEALVRQAEELRRLQVELEELSFKDGLTGVANRRMFDRTLEREWAHAHREKRPLGVVMVDIDYFKNYNDQLGHIKGDDCLARIADLLKSAASRQGDLVARYGGEEFAIILPSADQEAATRIAETCCQIIAEDRILHPASKVSSYVTVSVGAHSMVPDKPENCKSLLSLVDQQMYRAKGLGRNRVCVE